LLILRPNFIPPACFDCEVHRPVILCPSRPRFPETSGHLVEAGPPTSRRFFFFFWRRSLTPRLVLVAVWWTQGDAVAAAYSL